MTARVLLALLVSLLTQRVAAADDTVAAQVNGVAISEREVNDVVRAAISGRPTPPTSDEIAQLSHTALESLIDFELLQQAANARGIRVSESDIDAEIARNKARFASAGDYDKAITASGLSHDALRADTRKTLAVNTLLATVVWKDVKVSPDAVRAYYDQHKDQLGGKSFDELRPAIERALLEDAQQQAQRAFVADLRKTAKIELSEPTPAAAKTGR
jgi:parvulin-like peptidyl-prolyl isomerase